MNLIKNSKHPLIWYSLLSLLLVGLMGAMELWLGRNLACPCGIKLWHSVISNYGNSQHLFDWYSMVHVLHGLAYYWLVTLFDRKNKLSIIQKFVIAVFLSCAFEVIENTKWIIAAYRSHYSTFHYTGDSVVNSIGDVISVSIGFWVTTKAKLWMSITFFCVDVILIVYALNTVITSNTIIILDKIQHMKFW